MISENIKKVHGTPMCFKTIAELEAYQYAEEFEIDDIIHLLGVVSVGDGLGHARKVSLIDDTTGILLTDGRYANIVPNSKLSDKANKAVQIIAGKGLTGGGTIGDDVNLSIVPANDSMVVTENDVQVNTADDLVTESSTRPLSAKMGKKLATEKINFTDIVNDLTTGGVNKVPSAETVKLLKQLIDAMGSGGAAQLAYQLKSAEKSRIPSYGTLNAGGSVIVASSGIIVDPNVFINGELLNPDEYTINKQDSTITLKTPVKYQAIYFIDDTYAPKYKFSVSTVNFLVNAPTLKSKLALGDVVDIQGESDAYDGGHHTRIVEATSKLNGVQLAEGLFLNEVPNSRNYGLLQSINSTDTNRGVCSKAIYDQLYTFLFDSRYKQLDSTKVGKFMRIVPKSIFVSTRPMFTLRFRSVGGSRQAFYQDIKICRSWGEDFKIVYVEKVFPVVDEVHCKIDSYANNGERVGDLLFKLAKCDSTDVALLNDLGVSVDFDIEYLDSLPVGEYNKKFIDLHHMVLNYQSIVYRGELNSGHNLNDFRMMGTYLFRSATAPTNGPPVSLSSYGSTLEVLDFGVYTIQKCYILSSASIMQCFVRSFDGVWGAWKEV